MIGALVPLLQNLHSTTDSVGDGTYAAFIALMGCGAVLACFIANPKNVVRTDGTKIILVQNPTWKTELIGLWACLKQDKSILLLFPMFFASNWFYTYQFNDYNLAQFNIRTRSLNNLVYWAAQIIGAGTFGLFLDWTRLSRRSRARAAWCFVLVLTCAIWFGTLGNQLGYTRKSVAASDYTTIDFSDSASSYGPRLFLYLLYGYYDAVWQCFVYWLLGAFSNNARSLAFYVGFYKGIQSAGAAIIYRLDALEIPYINLWGSTTALLLAGLLCAFPIVFYKITNHTESTDSSGKILDGQTVDGTESAKDEYEEKVDPAVTHGPVS